jgi:hypothetical protein
MATGPMAFSRGMKMTDRLKLRPQSLREGTE